MLPLGHGGSPQYWIFTNERGMKTRISVKTSMPELGMNPRSSTFRAGGFTTAPGPPLKCKSDRESSELNNWSPRRRVLLWNKYRVSIDRHEVDIAIYFKAPWSHISFYFQSLKIRVVGRSFYHAEIDFLQTESGKIVLDVIWDFEILTKVKAPNITAQLSKHKTFA